MGSSLDYVVELMLEKGLVSKLAVSAAKESVRENKGYGEENDNLLNVLIKNGDITTQEIYQMITLLALSTFQNGRLRPKIYC